MNPVERCAAVIPCLNEAAPLADLLARTQRILPSVIVVDDGSRDDTAVVARRAGADLIRHDRPRGKGASLLAGWRRAMEKGFEWALSMDGDGQHAPEDIPRFLDCAIRTQARLVIGNRMDAAGGMPFVRRWVNRWMSRRISRLTGRIFPDTQCGFRLMHLRTGLEMEFQADHFEIESEVLCRFAAAGERIEFVPVRVIYGPERSKIRPLLDALRWASWWRRARRQFRSRP